MAEATSATRTDDDAAAVTATNSEGGNGSGNANVAVSAVGTGGTGTSSGEGSSSSLSSSSASSSNTAGRQSSSRDPPRTLIDVMREPSTTVPDVVVLNTVVEDRPVRQRPLNPREDLWLTTADGRYSSSIIPLRVGTSPYCETFFVHKHVLIRYPYFEKALCGGFLEAETQSMDFPEEDPNIFHFLVAYLYEGRYEPIKPVATVLTPDDKGKYASLGINDPGADSDASSTTSSDASINNPPAQNQNPALRAQRRRERQRRREERHYEHLRQKHPGLHRPSCNCPQCLTASGPPCWSCRAPRAPPPPPPPPHIPGGVGPHHHPVLIFYDRHHQADHRRQQRRAARNNTNNNNNRNPPPPPPPPPGGVIPPIPAPTPATIPPNLPPPRISSEDLSTWLQTYELSLDVYILANKFCLYGFMKLVARTLIDLLESAGTDAAVPEVLYLCSKIYSGLPESDPLLKMIFARVAFLQPWRSYAAAAAAAVASSSPSSSSSSSSSSASAAMMMKNEAKDWLDAHPEISSLLLIEMAARRDLDFLSPSSSSSSTSPHSSSSHYPTGFGWPNNNLPSLESYEGGEMYGYYTGGPQHGNAMNGGVGQDWWGGGPGTGIVGVPPPPPRPVGGGPGLGGGWMPGAAIDHHHHLYVGGGAGGRMPGLPYGMFGPGGGGRRMH